MDLPDWVYEGMDVGLPSAARIYDYLLGGSHNLAVDREVARLAVQAMPDVAVQARANRDFLQRAVRFLVAAGIGQFLDLGAGMPTEGSVHELAAGARVVYVDLDPVAVAHSRKILAGCDGVTAVAGDFRRPAEILADPQVRAVLDLDQPVAVLLVAVLHALPDQDDPFGAVAQLREALAPGSYLVIAHGTDESRPAVAADLVRVSQRTTTPLIVRSRAEITRFFDGFELIDPGLVWAPQWRPDAPVPEQPELSGNLVGVGLRHL